MCCEMFQYVLIKGKVGNRSTFYRNVFPEAPRSPLYSHDHLKTDVHVQIFSILSMSVCERCKYFLSVWEGRGISVVVHKNRWFLRYAKWFFEIFFVLGLIRDQIFHLQTRIVKEPHVLHWEVFILPNNLMY